MNRDEIIERLEVDPTAVVELARARFADGQAMRGLPRPEGLPEGGWFATIGVRGHRYLYWRWRDDDHVRGRCLGRLN